MVFNNIYTSFTLLYEFLFNFYNFKVPNNITLCYCIFIFNHRKDEAANKPKMEFIPKTLADLHVDALPTSDAMNGGNFSFHGKTHSHICSHPK